jgi:hypothetical protein
MMKPLSACPPSFFHRLFAAFALFAVCQSALQAASAESNIFILDTRGTGSLTVTGRVLSNSAGLPLAGAAVTLGSGSVQSDAAGNFELRNVAAASGASLSRNHAVG